MATKKIKLNKLLINRKIVANEYEANNLIKSGDIIVNGLVSTNINSQYPIDISIKVNKKSKEWVSRGAHKLLRAVSTFNFVIQNKVCIDIGASTGGFTDVLLSKGASKVYAVDVGYGQLAWKLRTDPRVSVMERTNARFLTNDMFPEKKADVIVSDASFISMKLLLPVLQNLLTDEGSIIVLIKPQFEISKNKIGNGVVRDASLHLEVLNDFLAFSESETKLKLVDATYSPIKGPEGNIEFLFHYKLRTSNTPALEWIFDTIVREAHKYSRNKTV